MEAQKIRSVKQASFYGIMGGSIAFVIINFIIFAVFLVTFVYLFISNQEKNLSNILVSNLTDKQERVVNVSKSLAKMIVNQDGKNLGEANIENYMLNFKEIEGILILDNRGVVTETSISHKQFIGIDLSGKDYYKKIESGAEKDTFVSDSYVSHMYKKLTLNVVSPVLKDDKLLGMVVVLLSPGIIENKELEDMEYYLVDSNGDIIFQSYEGNVLTKEDNIKNSLIMKEGIGKENPLLYKDKLINALVLGNIRIEPTSSMYVIVQYNVLGNTALLRGLFIILVIAAVIMLLFIVVFSVQVSSTVTNYINIFKNEVNKISTGNYDVSLQNKYPHLEVNEIMDNFNNMAHKVKHREEELQAYNEELVAANDEIKSMLTTLNETEKDKKEQYLEIIWTMVNLLEIKDEYTAGHSKSVTYYAQEIAEKLNTDYGFNLNVERIQIAAMLHDIGKIGIEREILSKPSKLTKEEYEIIKSHSNKGYYALKDIKSLKEERQIIKYHHEKYNGTGYPEGLAGDDIPLGARIICVADAFDAMVSDRPYRKGMPFELALEELVKNKKSQFDPLIVDVFVDMVRESQKIGDG